AEDGIRDFHVTGVQTCALPIYGFWLDLDELSQGILKAAGYRYCTAQADIQIGELLRCQLGCRIHGSACLGNNDLGETKLRNGLLQIRHELLGFSGGGSVTNGDKLHLMLGGKSSQRTYGSFAVAAGLKRINRSGIQQFS